MDSQTWCGDFCGCAASAQSQLDACGQDGERRFTGVGVGRALVLGPVVKVFPPPQAPVRVDVVDGSPVVPGDSVYQVSDDAVAESLADAPLAMVHAQDQPHPTYDPAVIAPAFDAVADRLLQRSADATGVLSDMLAAAAEMAKDPVLRAEAVHRVEAGEAPAEAVERAVERFVDIFQAAGGHLAERVVDVQSVGHRVVAQLLGQPEPGVPVLTEPSVIVANDLSPADTAALDVSKVLAIVTAHGGPTGHTAIIAGQLGIPCVVRAIGVMVGVREGDQIAVDAASGQVVINPGQVIRDQAARRARIQRVLAEDFEPSATSDGHFVHLLANIGTPEDAVSAAETPCEGVGLFRTEVLYLDKATAPTFDEQCTAYQQVFQTFDDSHQLGPSDTYRYEGRKVTVRTLDAGADKPLAFIAHQFEENPALGVRGYRVRRREPELLAVQLRAIAAAAQQVGTQPWVMAPMISTAAEAQEFVGLAHQAGLAPGAAMVGVMIEVPAAALCARDIVEHVDFVSIGTNDLAQYTMAADRLRGSLVDLIDTYQPAVLRLIAQVVTAARDADKPVSVCGESAGDPLLALVFAGMGITALSMSTGALPSIRYALRQHTLAQCQQMAQVALAANCPLAARDAVKALVDPEVVEALAL